MFTLCLSFFTVAIFQGKAPKNTFMFLQKSLMSHFIYIQTCKINPLGKIENFHTESYWPLHIYDYPKNIISNVALFKYSKINLLQIKISWHKTEVTL